MQIGSSKLQMEEQETETYPYAAITTYLQSGMYPPDADKKEKRGLCKRAKYFVLFGGKLQYVGGNKNTPRLVVEGEEDRRKIIESIHGQAHLGRDKTLSQLTQRYYWPNMYKTACAYVSFKFIYLVIVQVFCALNGISLADCFM